MIIIWRPRDQGDLSGETFDNLFVSILAKEKWDLILFVQPVGSYVNDGFRDMTMAGRPYSSQFFPAFGSDERAIFNQHSFSLSSGGLPRKL